MSHIPASIQALSGSIGSSLANLALFPLDVATVRAQVERDTAVTDGKSVAYESVPTVIKRILNEEGWKSFFEGAGSDLVATALQSFLYFFVYNKLRNHQLNIVAVTTGKLDKVPRLLNIQTELLNGAVAGVICKLFTTPLKNIVLLKQLSGDNINFGRCVHEIYRSKGLPGFWSGYKATFFLSANPSLAYYFYQLLGSRHRSSAAKVFLRAAIAKSMALLLTYPVILAKTRSQASHVKKSMLSEMWTTLKTNGLLGLYDGADGQLVKGIFTQGITMTTKESIEHAVLAFMVRMYKFRL